MHSSYQQKGGHLASSSLTLLVASPDVDQLLKGKFLATRTGPHERTHGHAIINLATNEECTLHISRRGGHLASSSDILDFTGSVDHSEHCPNVVQHDAVPAGTYRRCPCDLQFDLRGQTQDILDVATPMLRVSYSHRNTL